MKKIGILTYHRANNYGAVLQAYALQEYLKKNGADSKIIDYRNEYLEKMYRGYSISLKNMVRDLLDLPVKYLKDRAFEKFRNNYLNCSELYEKDSIIRANEEFDNFIFGSDQIWNYALSNNDSTYLGSFVKDNFKLNSYAASFGTYRSTEETYREMLVNFKNISVREESGKCFYEKLTGRNDFKVVVDPVFLLTPAEWHDIASKKKYKDYIFLYTLQGKNTKMIEVAKKLSEKTGLKIVEMQAWIRPKARNLKPRFCDDPLTFLGWIKDANYVVTDSFHCTAFSIIFKKIFWVKISECDKASDSRVGNLIYKLHLEKQILTDNFNEVAFETKPDYEEAYQILDESVNNSKIFLNNILYGDGIT